MCPMWQNLTKESKTEYQRMILGFASLTEMFAQKAENESEDVALSPIINSKYQETVFQKVFNASAEDIGNTAYDAALCLEQDDKELKFLVGIKTFGISSGAQKIAQFKANHDDWAEIINMIKSNAYNEDGTAKTKAEIDSINHDLLDEYEPLTSKRLKEIGINGIRLVKYAGSADIHLQFVWIDDKDLPGDYIK